MKPNQLTMRAIEADSPEWEIAVENKRQRAFGMVEQEGFSRQEIERRYDAYRQEKGISFHDERLRQEVGDGQLLTWWQDDKMVAYAPVSTSQLIGSASHGVFNVVDVWAQQGLSEGNLDQIVGDLLEQSRVSGTPHVQIHCDHQLADANLRLGGAPIKHWFQFKLE